MKRGGLALVCAGMLASGALAQVTTEQAREHLTRVAIAVDAVSLVQYAAQGDGNTVALLLVAGVPVSARDPVRGVTALHNAAAMGQVPVIDQLLSRQADVNAQDWLGLTPLINAIHGGHGKVIERLLKAGARVDVQPVKGPTALLAAVHAGRIEIVQQLLDAGASPSQADAFGMTPLEFARSAKRQLIAKLLAERS